MEDISAYGHISAGRMVNDFGSSLPDDAPMAPLFLGATASFADDTVEITVIRLDARPEAVRASAALLSGSEQDRASRFAFDCDRRRYTIAHARLRQLLAARLGVRPESIELTYGVHGKPSLAGANSDLRFNISYANDVAVCALSRGREIGIDIEAIRVIPDADGIAAWLFSHRENGAYRALGRRVRPLGFLNCWTRKEAFVKALGDGLYYPLDRFDVSLVPGETAQIQRVGNVPGNRCGWELCSFAAPPGYVGAVCLAAAS